MMAPCGSIAVWVSVAARPSTRLSRRMAPCRWPACTIFERCCLPKEPRVAQEVYQQTFPNGLTLLAERMEHVRSAALNFLVPAGCVYDPPEQAGVASVLAEMITRGAGERDSRELTLALDNLGFDRDESVGSMHTRFWGATLARNIPPALEI